MRSGCTASPGHVVSRSMYRGQELSGTIPLHRPRCCVALVQGRVIGAARRWRRTRAGPHLCPHGCAWGQGRPICRGRKALPLAQCLLQARSGGELLGWQRWGKGARPRVRSRWSTCDETARLQPRRRTRLLDSGSAKRDRPHVTRAPRQWLSPPGSRRACRFCSSGTTGEIQAKVMGSACTPWVRPIIGVSLCSTRAPDRGMKASRSAARRRHASRMVRLRAVSTTSEDVRP